MLICSKSHVNSRSTVHDVMAGTWCVMSTSMIDYWARFVSEIINSHNVLQSDVTFWTPVRLWETICYSLANIADISVRRLLSVCGKKARSELWPLSTSEPVKLLFLGHTRHKIYNNIPRIEDNLKVNIQRVMSSVSPSCNGQRGH